MADFTPVASADVSDEKLVVGELRALRVEMRSWFEALLGRIDRFEQRIQQLELHRTDVNQRLDRHEHRIAALEAAVTNKP